VGSKQLKNDGAIELAGQMLNRRFKMFSMTAYSEAPDGTITIRTINNIAPATGRAFFEKMKTPGVRVDSTTRFIHPDGHVELFVPAANTTDESAKVIEQQSKEPRKVYRPGQGWADE